MLFRTPGSDLRSGFRILASTRDQVVIGPEVLDARPLHFTTLSSTIRGVGQAGDIYSVRPAASCEMRSATSLTSPSSLESASLSRGGNPPTFRKRQTRPSGPKT